MYVVFRGTPHFLFSYPVLSILGMFMMTMGEFSDFFANFDTIRQPDTAKVSCFIPCITQFFLLCFVAFLLLF